MHWLIYKVNWMALFGCKELFNKRCNGFYTKDVLIVWNVAWMPLSWNVDLEQMWDLKAYISLTLKNWNENA